MKAHGAIPIYLNQYVLFALLNLDHQKELYEWFHVILNSSMQSCIHLLLYFPKKGKKTQATKSAKGLSSKNSAESNINKEGIIFKTWSLTSKIDW